MCEGAAQAVEMGGIVEAKLGAVEQEHGGVREVEVASVCDAIEPGAQVGWRVLGAEEQDRTGLGDGEASECRTAGGDRERKLGGAPGLERLGGTAEQADRRVGGRLPGRGIDARKAVAAARSYIRLRKSKMRYAGYYTANLPIGSGATESTCWRCNNASSFLGNRGTRPGCAGFSRCAHSRSLTAGLQPGSRTRPLIARKSR